MPWLAIVLEADAETAERLGDALLETGALALDVTDAEAGTANETPLFSDGGPVPAASWRRQRLQALFPAEVDAQAMLQQAMRAAGVSSEILHRVERVDDRDWVRESQRQFAPIRVSSRMWIVPSWHAAPDPAALNIVLDPGLAFGTGSHPSTRLCLRWLEAHVQGGETVIDFGCGSGILGIAALKLGARHVRAVDIDEQAVLAARRNAMHNRVQGFVAAHNAGGSSAQLVVANILARPLIVLAPLLARLTAPGGRISLSGLLAEQAEEVRAAYVGPFAMDELAHEEGWAMLGGVRRGD